MLGLIKLSKDLFSHHAKTDNPVKVLNEKAYNEAVKKEKESRLKQVQEDGVFENSESLELFQEFNEVLTPYIPRENFVA